jgi:alginate O-acetyltransferase complex protein AlgI
VRPCAHVYVPAPSWNFVIWGALHGLALAGTRAWQRWRAARKRLPLGPEGESAPLPSRRGAPLAPAGPWYARALGVVLTFHYVCFAWIFFRAPTLAHAKLMLARIGVGHVETANLSPRVVAVIAVALCLHFVPKETVLRVRDAFVRAPAVVQGLALAGVAMCLHVVAGAKAEPFVYGQF